MADGKIVNLRKFRERGKKQRGMEWEFLKGCLGGNIMPTDIDGIIERNGHYLIFEEKQPGVQLTKGQRIMLEDLNRRHGMTVFIIFGDTSVPVVTEMEIWRPKGRLGRHSEGRERFAADIDLVRTKVNAWYQYANRRPNRGTFGQ